MNIAIGSDHRGFKLKQYIMKLLPEMGHSYHDFGSYSEEPVDYPDIAKKAAGAVADGKFERGILICNTGTGMCIAANKVKGIRAALGYDVNTAQMARQHNNINILCLGAVQEENKIPEIIKAFLNTEFEGGRHLRRINKLAEMERD